jgi:L-asparaginase/beta-aspartyl-peptidase (threonine type)
MISFALAMHAGAGASRRQEYSREREHLQETAEQGRRMLRRGAAALDVAISVVAALEDSGLYVAGRGGSPNTDGEYEFDACVMEGHTRRAGAVAALRGFRSPVQVARLVMERTPHVMLCGPGAERFARDQDAEPIPEIDGWFTNACLGESNFSPGATPHGTVGCVVRDCEGRLASATSTAGVFGKMPGRVGDSPMIGAGAWADDQVAVSCTGQGELFIRTAAASQLAFLVRSGVDLRDAASRIIDEIAAMQGDGGLVAIDSAGRIEMPCCSEGMRRACLIQDGPVKVTIFDTE